MIQSISIGSRIQVDDNQETSDQVAAVMLQQKESLDYALAALPGVQQVDPVD